MEATQIYYRASQAFYTLMKSGVKFKVDGGAGVLPMAVKRQFLLDNPGPCVYCGSDQNRTVDHILPRCLGGTNELGNLQILCLGCNGTKSHFESAVIKNLRRVGNKLDCPSLP